MAFRSRLCKAWWDKILLGLIVGTFISAIYAITDAHKFLEEVYLKVSWGEWIIPFLLVSLWILIHKAGRLKSGVFTFVVSEGSITRRCIPNIYFSVVVGLVVFLMIDFWGDQKLSVLFFDKLVYVFVFFPFLIFLLLVIGLVLIPVAVSWAFQIFSIQKFLKFFCGSEDPGKKQEKGFKSVSLKELGEMPRKERNGIIKNWLENESPAQTIDFYNREKLVERMSKRLLDNNIKRGQVLFGDYGTGKTTALREVGEKLRESGEKWIISSVNTWGKTEEPEQLIEIVLESIISDISDAGIETTSLLSLPESYVRAAYTGYNYLSWLFLLDGAKSVRKVIAKINDALVLHDKKLLICIEDLDRVYDVRKAAPAIMGFLDEIGRGDLTNNGYDISSNIHFVFSLRRDEVTIEFANKTAEYIEDTSMSSSYSMLKFFFELCNNDPENPLPEGVIHLDRLYGKDDELPLIDDPSQKDANLIYLFRYLESARSTKRVLRSTREIFLALKGNATLTDIFKIQIMREHGDLYEMFKSLQPSDKSFAEMVTDASKASGKNKADTPISIGVDVTVGNLSSDGSPAQIYQLQGHSRDKTKTHATDHDAAINFLKKLDFVTSGGKGYGLAFAAPDNRTEILNVAPSNDNFLQKFLREFESLAKESPVEPSKEIIGWHKDKIPAYLYFQNSPLEKCFYRYAGCKFYYTGLLKHFFIAEYPDDLICLEGIEEDKRPTNPIAIFVSEALIGLKLQLTVWDLSPEFRTSVWSETQTLFNSWEVEIAADGAETRHWHFLKGCRLFWASNTSGSNVIDDKRKDRDSNIMTKADLTDAYRALSKVAAREGVKTKDDSSVAG